MKPRVLFIAPLPPPVHGSAAVSEQIRKSGVVNEAFECDFVNLSLSRRMDEIQTFSAGKVLRLLAIYWAVLWKLLTHRYALCYCAISCFGVPFLKDVPVVLLCRLFRCRVLIHQHNKGMSHYCQRPFYRTLYRWVYGNAKVMLLSWRLYDDISDIVRREQVCICPNGVALPISSSNSTAEGTTRFLYLSNLIPSKGCNVLLDALVRLKERRVAFQCDFIGGDCPEQSAETFAAQIEGKGLGECVRYLGRKYGEEKELFWQQSDVFVFPTFYAPECFPMVLLEAMAHGLPCVTTAEAAIPDIVEDGAHGKVCPARDASSLADALQWMTEHPAERKEMGRRGREKFLEHYTLEAFERRFVAALQACCG